MPSQTHLDGDSRGKHEDKIWNQQQSTRNKGNRAAGNRQHSVIYFSVLGALLAWAHEVWIPFNTQDTNALLYKAVGRKSSCACPARKKTATPAPGSLLPTCHHGRQRMELCQCKQRTQYSLETAGSIASSLLGHRWLIRDDNYVSCFLLSALEGVSSAMCLWECATCSLVALLQMFLFFFRELRSSCSYLLSSALHPPMSAVQLDIRITKQIQEITLRS